MQKKILSWITVLAVTVTMLLGGSAAVFADEAETTGSLMWGQKVETTANSWGTYGVGTPVLYGDSVYVVSYDKLVKYDAVTGTLQKSLDIGGNQGFNKFAPTVANGKMFIPLMGARLSIVDIDKMELIKTVTYAENQPKHEGDSPAIYSSRDNAVYIGSWGGIGAVYVKISLNDYSITKLAEIVDVDDDADDKEQVSNGFYWAGAAVNEKFVVFGSDAVGDNAVLYVYDKDTGKTVEKTIEGSKDIRSTVAEYNGAYYFTAKNGKLYKTVISKTGEELTSDDITVSVVAELGKASTCTPVIIDGKAYVGYQTSDFKGGVKIINLADNTVVGTYEGVPADVKSLFVSGDKIFSTYNKSPGGIWDVKAGKDYFTPETDMQQYCIAGIVSDSNGILYYTNDSNYLMAVKPVSNVKTYAVNVKAGKGGKVTASASSVEENGNVEITVTPDEGYQISKVMVNGETQKLESKKADTIKITNIKKDTDVTAEFEKISVKNSEIEVTVQKETAFYMMHEKLKVSSDLAERYGYNDTVGYDKVSALDALVAAQIKKSGSEDKKVINDNLVMSGYGSPEKVFGLGSASEWTGFAVNEDYYSVDGNGTTVNSTPLENGDRIDYFWYEDVNWADKVTVFTDKGEKTFKKNVKTGEEFNLTLKGFIYMMGYTDHDYDPVKDAVICYVDDEGNANPLMKNDDFCMTDEKGNVTLEFDKPGTYYLTAVNNDSNGSRLVMPWVKVDVTCAVHNYENGKCTECGNSIEYKVVIGNLKPVGNLTADNIKDKMIESIQGINGNIPEMQISLMDIHLEYSPDGGKTWKTAEQGKDFPDKGTDIVIPYPDGTNGSSYDFVVTHMFGKQFRDYTPEDIERLIPEETKAGLKLHITSCSPYAVGWEKTVNAAVGNTDNSGDNNAVTGDDFNPVLFAVIAVIALIAAAAVIFRRKRFNS